MRCLAFAGLFVLLFALVIVSAAASGVGKDAAGDGGGGDAADPAAGGPGGPGRGEPRCLFW